MTQTVKHLLACLALAAVGQTAVAQPSASTAGLQSATGECEIHVWPTRNGVANVQGMVSVLGVVGQVADFAAHQQVDKTIGATVVGKIPPDAQAAVMQREDVLSALRLPPTSRVVIEDTLPAYAEEKADAVATQRLGQMGAALDAGTRLTPSLSACYAELLVSGVGYTRSPLDPPALVVRWIYRRWHDGKAKATIGWRRHPLPRGFGTNAAVQAAPEDMMRETYAATLIEWAHKKVKS